MSLPPFTQQFDLSDKTAIVTGASGGLGHAIAMRLAEVGANIIVHYLQNQANAQSLVAEIQATGRRAHAVQADIRSQAGCELLMNMTVQALGTPHLLINNAGAQPVSALMDMQSPELQTVMNTNISAPITLTKMFANMQQNNHQPATDTNLSIINIASIEGIDAKSGHSHYASSKAALIAFTKAAALELGPQGVRVNAVSPGLINRDGLETAWPEGVAAYKKASPLGRIGHGDDIANAVTFLSSDAARWITGANLVIDGGVCCAETW